MKLNDCKTCSSHICILKNVVLCGFKIDRAELPIHKSEDDDQLMVSGCPKEN